jgi:TRAP transporter TAXI family solute receptor
VPGAGGIGNPTRIFKGDADIGVSYALFLSMARDGEYPYTEKHTNLRALFSLTSNTFHMLVDDSIEAKYFEDIVEKKIGLKLGTAFLGDSDYFVLEKIFGELGVTMDVLEAWGGSMQLVGTSERVAIWQDRHINALHSNIEYPAAAITEAMASRKGKLLGLTEPIRDMMVKKYGFVKTEIPPGTYPNQDYSVPTIMMPMVLFTTADAPMEAIYLITKVVAESEERFKAAYGAFKTWEPEGMVVEGLGIQIHEGALKYYRERGWVN